MNKREACHRLADINERIYELEELLADVESRLRWDDDCRKEWYRQRRSELISDLERCRRDHDEFIQQYSDVIYS